MIHNRESNYRGLNASLQHYLAVPYTTGQLRDNTYWWCTTTKLAFCLIMWQFCRCHQQCHGRQRHWYLTFKSYGTAHVFWTSLSANLDICEQCGISGPEICVRYFQTTRMHALNIMYYHTYNDAFLPYLALGGHAHQHHWHHPRYILEVSAPVNIR